jgi:hypothetical protein
VRSKAIVLPRAPSVQPISRVIPGTASARIPRLSMSLILEVEKGVLLSRVKASAKDARRRKGKITAQRYEKIPAEIEALRRQNAIFACGQ